MPTIMGSAVDHIELRKAGRAEQKQAKHKNAYTRDQPLGTRSSQ